MAPPQLKVLCFVLVFLLGCAGAREDDDEDLGRKGRGRKSIRKAKKASGFQRLFLSFQFPSSKLLGKASHSYRESFSKVKTNRHSGTCELLQIPQRSLRRGQQPERHLLHGS